MPLDMMQAAATFILSEVVSSAAQAIPLLAVRVRVGVRIRVMGRVSLKARVMVQVRVTVRVY